MRALKAIYEPFVLMLVGTVVLASVLPARGGWRSAAGWIADGAIMLLFFLHGAKLSRQAIWDGTRHWRLHLATLSTTFVVFPLLGLTMLRLPFVSGPLAIGLLFLTLLPSTVQSSIAFTSMARGNVVAAVVSASFSNLVGILLTPFLVSLLIPSTQGGGGVSLEAVRTILLQLLLPFTVGHVARPVIGGFIGRHKTLVTVVDRGSILLVVYTAFGAAVVAGLWQEVSGRDLAVVATISMTLLSIVLAITWGLGGLLGLERKDRIVLLFCGSKKSLASGVPMAGVLFPAAKIGPIILPLMLFHQLQLIACAMIARRLGGLDDLRNGARPCAAAETAAHALPRQFLPWNRATMRGEDHR